MGGIAQLKKQLTAAEYERWYHFYDYHLSSNGTWVSYLVQNPSGNDTLVLQKTTTALKRTFLGGKQGRFSPQSDWYCYLEADRLYYLHLASGQLDSLPGITAYTFSKSGGFLLAESTLQKNELQLIHLASRHVKTIANVQEYVLSPYGTEVGIIQKEAEQNLIKIIPLTSSFSAFEILRSDEPLSSLTWNSKGDGVAFFEHERHEIEGQLSYQLHFISLANKKHRRRIKQRYVTPLLPVGYRLPLSRLFFSSDDEQLFFDVEQRAAADRALSPLVVWSSSASVLPPTDADNQQKLFLVCWHLATNQLMLVSDPEHSVGVPSSTGEHALVLNPLAYLPHFEYGGIYVDLYAKNLRTGYKKLLAKKINHQKNHIQVSPGGNYITWFVDKNWYIYRFDVDQISCLTCSIDARFEAVGHDYPGDKFPNDKPYWTTGDASVLLSDSHDIWLLSPDGKTRKKITNGQSINNRFSIYDEGFYRGSRDHFIQYSTRALDPSRGFFIKEVSTDNLNEGFCLYRSDRGLERVVFTDDKVTSVQHAGGTFMYVLSDFDKSPELVVQKVNQTESTIVQRSNEHQNDYYWGKSELIHYTVDGIDLKGALFYPADYSPEKSYPMVVRIYQELSSDLRQYLAPRLANSTGFNKTNLTLNGYFVLCPDIRYTINKTGESALKCVLAAVDKAVATANIDEHAIGLFGHSFGGFEVSYIITQTQRFRTAISGAGWHDLVGTYLGTDDQGISSMWRFDTQQLRLTAPYYSADFLNNSPILLASSVTTPLLLWAGTSDSRIRWENSSKMQMALWRLGKKSTFLVYPDEQHFMIDKKNQLDLTAKTLEWFDYYLKGASKPNWIE